MKRISFLLLVAATVFTVSCKEKAEEPIVKGATEEAAFDIVAARSAIDLNNKTFVDNFNKGDTAAIALVYHDDAIISPPDMPRIKKDAVASTFGMFRRMGVEKLTLTTVDLQGDANTLIENGNWEIFIKDDKKVDNGKYLVVWKNVNGSWKMFSDCWNSDNPPAPAK